MHGPELRRQILALRFKIDSSSPEECVPLHQELDKLFDHLRLITKSPINSLRQAIDTQYPDYVIDECGKNGVEIKPRC